MKNMSIPGFTAEASLSKHRTCYRMGQVAIAMARPAVIPQFSCWRVCYPISSTNHELANCTRVCSQIKNIFLLSESALST